MQRVYEAQVRNYDRDVKERSSIFAVRPTVHTNLSRKWSFSERLFKLEEFENTGFMVF